MNKEEKYRLLTEQIRSLIEGEKDVVAVMANVAAAIHETMGFFWTGFYRVMPKGGSYEDSGQELVLGPFQGPVACMHIAFGRGYRLWTRRLWYSLATEGDDRRARCRAVPWSYRLQQSFTFGDRRSPVLEGGRGDGCT